MNHELFLCRSRVGTYQYAIHTSNVVQGNKGHDREEVERFPVGHLFQLGYQGPLVPQKELEVGLQDVEVERRSQKLPVRLPPLTF